MPIRQRMGGDFVQEQLMTWLRRKYLSVGIITVFMTYILPVVTYSLYKHYGHRSVVNISNIIIAR